MRLHAAIHSLSPPSCPYRALWHPLGRFPAPIKPPSPSLNIRNASPPHQPPLSPLTLPDQEERTQGRSGWRRAPHKDKGKRKGIVACAFLCARCLGGGQGEPMMRRRGGSSERRAYTHAHTQTPTWDGQARISERKCHVKQGKGETKYSSLRRTQTTLTDT